MQRYSTKAISLNQLLCKNNNRYYKISVNFRPLSLNRDIYRNFFSTTKSTFLKGTTKTESSGKTDFANNVGKEPAMISTSPNKQNGSEVLSFFVSGIENIVPGNNQNLSNMDVENYLNHCMRALGLYKGLPPTERSYLRDKFVSVLESDYLRLSECLPRIKSNKFEQQSSNILNLFFKFANYCFSLNLHTPKLYNSIMVNLQTVGTVFQFQSTRRFPLILMYMYLYEKNFQSNRNYLNLMNYFQQPENFNKIITKASKEECIMIIDSLTYHKITDKKFKALICQEIIKKVQADTLNKEEVIKLFALLCRGQAFSENEPSLQIFEKQILSINLKQNEKIDLSKALLNINHIRANSKEIHAKILNLLSQTPWLMTEEFLITILRDFDGISLPQYMYGLCNSFIETSYGKLSISTLALFIYHFVKKKILDISLFQKLEEHILNNMESHKWTWKDCHYILWSCLSLNFDDSPLFPKLEPHVHAILQNSSTSFEVMNILLWNVSQGAYLPNFGVFKTVLNNLRDKSNIYSKNSSIDLATTLYSISLLIVKYKTFDTDNYEQVYRKHIEQQLLATIPLINTKITQTPISSQSIENQVKIFQAMMTFQIEFPEVFSNCKNGAQIIEWFKSEDFQPRTISSNLSVDIETLLKQTNIEYKSEYKVYVYFIDAFIEPNIALQFEGLKHYTRNTRKERHQYLLRDFHLEKLGYRNVKIPFFEFRKIFFTDVEKQKEYIRDKLFNQK